VVDAYGAEVIKADPETQQAILVGKKMRSPD